MIEYVGNSALYPASITIMEDGEFTDADSYAVALQQLADRTAYLLALHGGIGFDFTNATFHGTTTFADGSIVAPGLTSIALTSNAISITVGAGELNVQGIVRFNNDVQFMANGDFATASFQGNVTLNGVVTPGGLGRVKKRTVALPEATHTLSIEEADIFIVPLLSANQSYPLSDLGAEEGDTLRVEAFANESAFVGQITYPGRTWSLRNSPGGGGTLVAIEFLFTATGWVKLDGVIANALING